MNSDYPNDGLLIQQLSEVPVADRQPMIASHLHELVACVLQLDSSQFSEQETLTSLGMDSMMAIEVKHRIEASLKVDISVLDLLQEITVAQLAGRILSSLQLDESAIAANDDSDISDIQQLIDLADSEDLERLLAELEQSLENEAAVQSSSANSPDSFA